MRHTWYLTEQLVVFALVDDAVDVEDRKLLNQEIPPEFIPRKPTLPVVTKEPNLQT